MGKSTLANGLIKHWRARGERVGMVAVDPSSQQTHGALLGDRTRLDTDPTDGAIFVRSMAARDRLGGLSHEAYGAIVLMRALFDRVLVESVGIGQSEADIALAADSIILCIQPGAGDALQYMKAGIMELPDIVAVTKADMGKAARRAKADVTGALSLACRDASDWDVPVLLVCAKDEAALDALGNAINDHRALLGNQRRLQTQRSKQMCDWLSDRLRSKFGTIGLKYAELDRFERLESRPFETERLITERLLEKLSTSEADAE